MLFRMVWKAYIPSLVAIGDVVPNGTKMVPNLVWLIFSLSFTTFSCNIFWLDEHRKSFISKGVDFRVFNDNATKWRTHLTYFIITALAVTFWPFFTSKATLAFTLWTNEKHLFNTQINKAFLLSLLIFLVSTYIYITKMYPNTFVDKVNTVDILSTPRRFELRSRIIFAHFLSNANKKWGFTVFLTSMQYIRKYYRFSKK